jgi:hypothetical protein
MNILIVLKQIWKVGLRTMSNKNKFKNGEEAKKVAPGFDDERFGEDATRDDKKKGNYTKVVRVFLDENDPSRK